MKRIRQYKSTILLSFILLLAAALRLYNISGFQVFLGDEGRDVLTAWHILHGDFTLLGPRSSAADFFYGPIYYYLITPFLLLFGYDPVGPAIFVALMGVATVWLVYTVAKDLFGEIPALVAALLYAVSPLVIIYSRSSWNPNILPFFSLLAVYLTYKALQKNSLRLFACVGVILGVSLQLHYLALFLGAVVAVYTLIETVARQKSVAALTQLGKRVLVLAGGFVIGLSLFLAFELRHGFPNSKTIINFIFSSALHPEQVVNHQPFFVVVWQVFQKLFLRVLTYFPQNVPISLPLAVWYVFVMGLAICSIIAVVLLKDRTKKLLLLTWLVVGVGLFGFYKKPLFDYYFAFLYPLPALLVSALVYHVIRNKKNIYLSILTTLACVGVVSLCVYMTPVDDNANHQKDQAKRIAEFVMSKTDGKPYNFALITPGNSDHAYRYFFEVHNRAPVTIENVVVDPGRKTVTDQLLIVCEDRDCQPLGNSLWEVAGFGRAEIAGEWDISVVKVYKLKHYEGAPEQTEDTVQK